MKPKIEGVFESLAAILVIFTAMIDPMISVVVAAVCLFGFGFHKIFYAKKR